MDKNYAIEAVRRLGKVLALHGVAAQKLVLFGSFAQGTQREGSDSDVVVVSDNFAGLSQGDRIDLLSKAIGEVWEPIEASAFTSEEWESGAATIHEYARNGTLIVSAP
jgi:predicted nucleotidyltransferase